MHLWGGRLYATGCNMVTGVEIWEYDGSNWAQVNQDGFGDANNTLGPAMTTYNGSLYVATTNDASGCEVWKYDGDVWIQVNEDGFGDKNNVDSFSMAVLADRLYVGTSNSAGCEIWELDGGDWTRVNTPGFGDTNNVAAFSMISFLDDLYVGTRNSFTGCEFWKMSYGSTGHVNADAGPDQIVEQESYGGTQVALDGSGSTDPDSTPGTNDDIVSFDWYEGENFLGSGEVIVYTFPLGPHTVTLVVTDSDGETDEDEVIITVQDTSPPQVSVYLAKDSLWPPNHKMVDVGFSFEIADICDAEPVVSIGVTSDEPTATAPGAGGSKHAPDADITDNGVLLRAERAGNGDGRVYMITVTAIDVSGNSTSTSAAVEVNHNKKKKAVDSGQNYDATEIN